MRQVRKVRVGASELVSWPASATPRVVETGPTLATVDRRPAQNTYDSAKPIWATIIIRYMWVQEGWFSVAASSSGRRTSR